MILLLDYPFVIFIKWHIRRKIKTEDHPAFQMFFMVITQSPLDGPPPPSKRPRFLHLMTHLFFGDGSTPIISIRWHTHSIKDGRRLLSTCVATSMGSLSLFFRLALPSSVLQTPHPKCSVRTSSTIQWAAICHAKQRYARNKPVGISRTSTKCKLF